MRVNKNTIIILASVLTLSSTFTLSPNNIVNGDFSVGQPVNAKPWISKRIRNVVNLIKKIDIKKIEIKPKDVLFKALFQINNYINNYPMPVEDFLKAAKREENYKGRPYYGSVCYAKNFENGESATSYTLYANGALNYSGVDTIMNCSKDIFGETSWEFSVPSKLPFQIKVTNNGFNIRVNYLYIDR